MTGTWGWIAIAAVPLAFWVLIITFMVIVFGRSDATERFEEVDLDEAAAAPAREAAPSGSGLAWRPPVPSHH